MKGIIRTIPVLCAALLLSAGTVSAGEAVVLRVTGDAFAAMAEGVSRVEPGLSLGAGDMLMARPGAAVDLLIDGAAAGRFLAGTTAAFAPSQGGGLKVLIAEGNAIFNVKKIPDGGQFLVDTPTAVAAVRGTQFWGRVAGGSEQADTTFAVRHGSIRVTPKATDVPVDLSPGQAVDIGSSAAPTLSRAATPDEMAAMKIADELAVYL